MTRMYLFPKILILFLIIIIFYRPLTWDSVLIIFFLSIIIVSLLLLIELIIRGKYYLYLKKKGKTLSRDKLYSVVHRLIGLVNRVLRINVYVKHYDRFDPTKTYLIIPNHQSNADATVLMEAFSDPVSFVAKASLSKIIIVREWMELIECLFLQKDDMRGQVRVMSDAAKLLEKGNSVIIFPEGKRSFTYEMNEFKSGTFKMATKTKVDILPVTLNNVYNMQHRYPFKNTDISVYIHESIPYEKYQDMSTQEIAKMVQAIVDSKIEKE